MFMIFGPERIKLAMADHNLTFPNEKPFRVHSIMLAEGNKV